MHHFLFPDPLQLSLCLHPASRQAAHVFLWHCFDGLILTCEVDKVEDPSTNFGVDSIGWRARCEAFWKKDSSGSSSMSTIMCSIDWDIVWTRSGILLSACCSVEGCRLAEISYIRWKYRIQPFSHTNLNYTFFLLSLVWNFFGRKWDDVKNILVKHTTLYCVFLFFSLDLLSS